MAFEPDKPAARGRFVPDSPVSEEVGRITEEQVAREQATLSPAQREEMRTRERVTYSPGQAALQALSAIPVLGGVAKGAQLATRGGRLAPYGQRAAELFIPQTGRELAKRSALTAAGGAAAQGVSNVLPEDTSPTARYLAELGTGMAVEGALGAGRSALKGFRPITPGSTERAAERVVRELRPERITTLPQVTERTGSVMRRMQEALRGRPKDEPIDAAEVARLLGVEAGAIRSRAAGVGEALAAGTERRLADISRPRTATEVGEEARDIVNKRLTVLKEAREKQVQPDKDAMFAVANEQEAAGKRVTDTNAFKVARDALDAMKSKKVSGPKGEQDLQLVTGDIAKQLDLVRKELTGISYDPMTGSTLKTGVSFARLENLRRSLGDRASGKPETGYDAIDQQQAGQLKKLIENVMKEFTGGKVDPDTGVMKVGAFEKYISNYTKLSEPINKFETNLGQDLVATLKQPRGVFAKDPMELPKAIFSSPRNVDDFIELAGGDKATVERLARNYVSEQLAGKTAAQINQFLASNRNWLAKFPQLRDDFANYAQRITREADVQTRLTKRTEERAGRLELGRDPAEQSRMFRAMLTGAGNERDVAAAAKVLSRTPEGVQAFKQNVRDVLGTEAPGTLEKMYRDRIGPAMRASGLYTPDELKLVDTAVKEITEVQSRITQAAARASAIPGAETVERMETRLINEELAEMKKGAGWAAAMAGTMVALLRGVDLPTPPASALGIGATGVAGGAVGLLAADRYRLFGARIREAVSDIVTDEQRLREVLKTPPAQREGVIGRMIRQSLGVTLGVNEPERMEENASTEGF
jgi:hypothetical protein